MVDPASTSDGTVESRVEEWLERRSYDGSAYGVDSLLRLKAGRTVSAILPARSVAPTIGTIVGCLGSLERTGLVDEVIVIDAGSSDGTATIAADAGANVYQRDEILTEHGASLGKGDALWRGLAVTTGDIVVFVDTDTRNFHPAFVTGLLGPLLEDPDLQFVKGAFERPLSLDGLGVEDEGGRVTELVAKPLINLFFPELAGFRQPLAGEIAARRSLLESLPFPVGYGVEIALLVDSWRALGLDALAQVDLGRREDRSKPLKELAPMATSVMIAAMRRAGIELDRRAGRLLPSIVGVPPREVPVTERPPLETLR